MAKRSRDLTEKPEANAWLSMYPTSADLFERTRAAMIARYVGENHGYINVDGLKYVEYRFNKSGAGYTTINAFKTKVRVRFYDNHDASFRQFDIRNVDDIATVEEFLRNSKVVNFQARPVGKEALEVRMATRQRTQAAYQTSTLVFDGVLSPAEGARRLTAEVAMNSNSARDHFYVYRQLRAGSVFHRGLSVEDMDYYLTRIETEQGEEALRLALQSLWLHIGYYEPLRKIILKSMRAMLATHEERARPSYALADISESFLVGVVHSMADSPEARRERLAAAPRKPKQVAVVSVAFVRNPDVVAEVLERADGKCERCEKSAPFVRRKDRTPYLEVHHRKQLADGGDDTVENAIALCPNCHRDLHYGYVAP